MYLKMKMIYFEENRVNSHMLISKQESNWQHLSHYLYLIQVAAK